MNSPVSRTSSAQSPKPLRSKPALEPLDQRVAARPVERRREVLHHRGVGVQRRERLAVGLLPGPQPEPLRAELGNRPTELAVAQRPIDCWYSVKPIPEQTAAMIQKRSMIFVSDQAIISK